ncbi:MAG: aquaporin [Phycisphaerae bacterium]|nr:aquaporin [Phycisphaerae bacterium]
MNVRSCAAEFIGTLLLVVVACGTAVLGGGEFAGALGVALAFGITLAVLAYALGPISGCHVNPAVTLGLLLSKKVSVGQAGSYWVAQFAGALAGAAIVLSIAQGLPTADVMQSANLHKQEALKEGKVVSEREAIQAAMQAQANAGKCATGYDTAVKGLAANGYGVEHSPGMYSAKACFIVEVLATFLLVFTVLMVTDSRHGAGGVAGLAIGFALFVGHLLAINVTNASINPARSFGPAVFVGGWAISQLWMFIVAPLAGAVVAAVLYLFLRGPAGEKAAAKKVALPDEVAVSRK